MRLLLLLFLLFTVLINSQSLSFAGQPEKAVALPEIIVSASVEPGEARSIPATVQVISRNELMTSGATTLDAALDYHMPGSGFIQPGGLSAIGMRGFRSAQSAGSTISDKVLILIDGHKSGVGNPAAIPLANVERVEILRGPMSVVYGGSAMGGVVNIVTKRGSGPLQGSLGARYGSYDQRHFEAGIHGALEEDRWGYAFGMQSSASGNYKDGDGHRYHNSASHNTGAGGVFTFRPQETSMLSAVGIHNSIYDTGSPGYYNNGLTKADEAANAYNYMALELEHGKVDEMRVIASLFANQNRYNFYDAQWSGDNSTYRSRTFGGRTVLGIPLLQVGRLALGAEYSRIEEDNYGKAVYQPNADYDIFGVFGEHTLDFDTVTLRYGLRYDHYKSSMRDTASLNVNGESKTYHHTSWSSGAIWWATDWFGLRASAGTAFVPPTAKNLGGKFKTSGPWGMNYQGNPDLKAESSISGEFGFEIDYSGLTASASYFYSRYKDRIIEKNTGAYITYANVGDQRLAGLNLSVKYTGKLQSSLPEALLVTPYFNGEFFTERKNRDNETRHLRVLAVPEYSMVAGLGLGYSIFKLDIHGRFTGSQTQHDPSSWQQAYMDSYAVYNAKFTVTPYDNLDIYLDIDNFTNKQYAYTWGYPRPGRTFSLGFRAGF